MTTQESTKKQSGRSLCQEQSLDRDYYFSENYFKEQLLASLCEQIIRVYNLKPKRLLEIGKGNGFVSDYLKGGGVNVTTFDINPNLNPDVVGSATELTQHFDKRQFDYVLCAEVLEHMPLGDSKEAIAQIERISSKGALVTLPVCQYKLVDIQAQCFLRFRRKLSFDINWFWAKKGKSIPKIHHWEINHSPETSMEMIRSYFSEHFHINDVSRSRLCPYHLFFTLQHKNK